MCSNLEFGSNLARHHISPAIAIHLFEYLDQLSQSNEAKAPWAWAFMPAPGAILCMALLLARSRGNMFSPEVTEGVDMKAAGDSEEC